MRRRDDEGGGREATPASYAEAQKPGELRRRVPDALRAGVSTREQSRLHGKGVPGVSKSEVSRLWVEEGGKVFGMFRQRSIVRADWLAPMLDGVALERDLVAVVALGLAEDGTKTLLNFELGASENEDVAKALPERLKRRGFAAAKDCRLPAVLDGASALRSAVSAHFPDAVFQRCLVRKERNPAASVGHAEINPYLHYDFIVRRRRTRFSHAISMFLRHDSIPSHPCKSYTAFSISSRLRVLFFANSHSPA
jgi:transposase-like protein